MYSTILPSLSRSVKFLGKLEATISDQETREGWWDELREEIKNHAKVLCCRYIIGYSGFYLYKFEYDQVEFF